MKKLFTAMLVVLNLGCFAQASKWFFTLSASPTIGGPSMSLKHQMVKQGFNESSTFDFFGLSGTIDYPIVSKSATFLVKGGYRLSNRRSLYCNLNISGKDRVEGFKNEGYSNFLGIFGGSYGQNIAIHYRTYSVAAGYLYSFPLTKIKLGVAPAVYLLHYEVLENYSVVSRHTPFVPGVSLLARVPLGRERRFFGVEFFVEGNLAPPVRIKAQTESGFHPGSANMIDMHTGFAFRFHEKK